MNRHSVVLVISCSLVVAMCFATIANDPANVDEEYHIAQIKLFVDGKWELFHVEGAQYPFLAMIPGYHAVVAATCWLFHPSNLLLWTRGMSAVTSIVFLVSTFFLIRAEHAEQHNYLRSAQIFFLPVLFPFYFVAYTEVLSVLMICMLIALHLRSFQASGIAATALLGIRQNLIVLVAGMSLLPSDQDRECSTRTESGFELCRRIFLRGLRAWPALLFFLVFMIFNGRISLTHPRLQQTTLTRTAIIGWTLCIVVAAVAYFQDKRELIPKSLIRTVRKCGAMVSVLFLLTIVGAAFDSKAWELVVGISIQRWDQAVHFGQQVSGASGNLLWSLATWTVLTLPIQWKQVARIFATCRRYPRAGSAVAMLLFVLCLCFQPLDTRNQLHYGLLRNYVILETLGSMSLRVLFATATVWGALSLISTHWRLEAGPFIGFVWISTLLPVLLIEPRYFIPAMLLALLFRERDFGLGERIQVVYSAVVSLALHAAHCYSPYFL